MYINYLHIAWLGHQKNIESYVNHMQEYNNIGVTQDVPLDKCRNKTIDDDM